MCDPAPVGERCKRGDALSDDVVKPIRGHIETGGSVLSDLWDFVLRGPGEPTLVDSRSPEARENYTQRILQRLDVSVDEYAILNIHQITVRAPVTFVFDELQRWDKTSSWWPNRLAALERVGGRLEHIRVFFL